MGRFVRTQNELSIALGARRNEIKRWRELGCPCGPEHKVDGQIDVLRVRKWLTEEGIEPGLGGGRMGKVTEQGGNGAGQKWVEERARTQEHKARLAELKVLELEGQVIPRAEVEAHDREKLEYLRDTIAQWSRSLGPALAGKTAVQIRRILEKKIEALFREFAGE